MFCKIFFRKSSAFIRDEIPACKCWSSSLPKPNIKSMFECQDVSIGDTYLYYAALLWLLGIAIFTDYMLFMPKDEELCFINKCKIWFLLHAAKKINCSVIFLWCPCHKIRAFLMNFICRPFFLPCLHLEHATLTQKIKVARILQIVPA